MTDVDVSETLTARLMDLFAPDSETIVGLEARMERFSLEDLTDKPISLSRAAGYLAEPLKASIPSPEEAPSVLAGIAAYVVFDPLAFDRALMFSRRMGEESSLAFRMAWASFEAANRSRLGLDKTGPILLAMMHADAAQRMSSYVQEDSEAEPTSEEIDELFGHPSTHKGNT